MQEPLQSLKIFNPKNKKIILKKLTLWGYRDVELYKDQPDLCPGRVVSYSLGK